MQTYKEVHTFDARDLRIWGVDLKDPTFMADYNAERAFWEADGRKKGGMEPAILYLLAKKHRKGVAIEPESKEPEKKIVKKELQTA
jgi:hypothetical protein